MSQSNADFLIEPTPSEVAAARRVRIDTRTAVEIAEWRAQLATRYRELRGEVRADTYHTVDWSITCPALVLALMDELEIAKGLA